MKINFPASNIVSFDKYGVKDVIMHPREYREIEFTDEELNYNPPEYLMPVNTSIPPVYTANLSISLSVPGKNRQSDMILYSYPGMQPINALISIMPGNDFMIKVLIEYRYNNQRIDFNGNEFMYAAPGEPASFTYKKTINLIAPANGEQNITGENALILSDIDEPAIYEYNLSGLGQHIRIYTVQKNIKLANFKTPTFSITKNTTFYWQVRKLCGFINNNELLSEPFVYSNKYNYIELSEERSFTTAP